METPSTENKSSAAVINQVMGGDTTGAPAGTESMSAADIKALTLKLEAEKKASSMSPKAVDPATIKPKIGEIVPKPKTEEKKVAPAVEQPKVETQPAEVKDYPTVEAPKPVEGAVAPTTAPSVATPETVQQMVQDSLKKIMEERGIEEKPQKQEPEFSGFKTQEELNEAFEKDQVGTTQKIFSYEAKKLLGKMVPDMLKEQLSPILAQIAPVVERAGNDTVKTHLTEVQTNFPEFKDQQSLLYVEVSKKIADKSNHKQIDSWVKEGKNPYAEYAKQVRAEHLPEYLKIAEEKGRRDTESRLEKERKLVSENGGKPTFGNPVQDVENMSLADLKKTIRALQ